VKSLDGQLNELNAKLDAAQREIQDVTGARDRAQSEATDFGHKLEEAESQLSQVRFGRISPLRPRSMTQIFNFRHAVVVAQIHLKIKVKGQLV